MDLRQLQHVAAIVDHGGFTKASAALHVAQPSLSQSVRALERELGVALFHRLGRSVRLTAAGEALLGPARAALRDAQTARAAALSVGSLEAGHLDLVALPTLSVEPAARLIGAFRQAHPRITVLFDEPEHTAGMLAMLRDGRCEIGLGDTTEPGAGLTAEALVDQEFLAVAPAATKLGRRGTATVAELATMPLLTTPAGTSTRLLTEDAFRAAGLEPVIAVETSHREALLPMVLAGAGVALLPRPLARDAMQRGAVAVKVTPPIRRTVCLLHRDGPLSPAAAAFAGYARGASYL